MSQVYFDKNRDRVDPAVCLNVIRLFYHCGHGNDARLQPTKDWVCDVLYHKAYLHGTRYYHTPEAFLYFFTRLIAENPKSDISRVGPLLKERLVQRVNCDADALALAMRVLACQLLGINNSSDLQRLLEMQVEDGSFEIGWLCRYGKTQIKIGNRALTTALAVAALKRHGY